MRHLTFRLMLFSTVSRRGGFFDAAERAHARGKEAAVTALFDRIAAERLAQAKAA